MIFIYEKTVSVIKHVRKIIGIFIFICFGIISFAQNSRTFLISSTFDADSSRTALGKNKIIPTAIEKECLMALSRYPELKDNYIEFVFAPINFTMVARPRWDFFLKSRKKRVYKIRVNNNPQAYTGLVYDSLSQRMKIGWIGHELGHVLSYTKMNNFQIIGFGISYLFPKSKRKIEGATDAAAIDHQLGNELYEATYYLWYRSNANPNYINNNKKYYLSPEEIKLRIKN